MVNIPIGFDVAIMVVRARVPLTFSQHFDLVFALHRLVYCPSLYGQHPKVPLTQGAVENENYGDIIFVIIVILLGD